MDGRIGVALTLGALAVAGRLRGSRSTDPSGIVVVRVEPHKVGFAGHQVVRSLARGKAHDPHAVKRVEVTLGADEPKALRNPPAVLAAAREAARPHLSHGHPRIASQVYPSSNPMGPRWLVRVEITV
jgi:hypothetical protein